MSHSSQGQSKRIVVLGAGFGGVYVARDLQSRIRNERWSGVRTGMSDVQVAVISRENYFLFTPLLHEVATGGLAPHTIVEPLRAVLGDRVDVRVGEVQRVRLADHVVETTAGEVPYDRLVIALGAETNFYGITGAAEHCLELKNMGDAIKLKRRAIDSFEAAARAATDEEREALLRFVVVGGGPTGVELAAELAEFIEGSLLPMYRASLHGAKPTVTMLQAGPELLPPFAPVTRVRALSALRRRGVDVRLNATVTAVDAEGVTLAGGERLPSRAVIWVAGVKPSALSFDAEVSRDRGGRIIVDQYMRLAGHDDVFVLGDIACSIPSGGTVPLPPFAQVAESQAKFVAAEIAAEVSALPDDVAAATYRDATADAAKQPRRKPFVYRSRGSLVSLGQWEAAAEIGRFRFWGRFAWWLWRTIYLTKFLSRRKKFLIALQWTINLVTPRDATRIATPNDPRVAAK